MESLQLKRVGHSPTPEVIGEAPEVLNVSSDEMESVMKEMGVITLAEKSCQNLAKLGVGLNNLGRVKYNNGLLFVSQQVVLTCMGQIQKKLQNSESVDELKTLGTLLGQLTEKLARSVKVSNESEEAVPQAQQAGRTLRPSFPVGAVVQQNNNYHIYPENSVPPKTP